MAGDFSPSVNFQCRLSYVVRTPQYAIACINICAHVKDPVVHVRVQWIMKTLKHPAGTVDRVARLCRSWVSPRKQPKFPMGQIRKAQYRCKYQIKMNQKNIRLKHRPSYCKERTGLLFSSQYGPIANTTKSESSISCTCRLLHITHLHLINACVSMFHLFTSDQCMHIYVSLICN